MIKAANERLKAAIQNGDRYFTFGPEADHCRFRMLGRSNQSAGHVNCRPFMQHHTNIKEDEMKQVN